MLYNCRQIRHTQIRLWEAGSSLTWVYTVQSGISSQMFMVDTAGVLPFLNLVIYYLPLDKLEKQFVQK